MPRLIILVLISAAIAVLAFGNADLVSLVILGRVKTPEMPFGLLLLVAMGVGALFTLLLYGLVGLHRPTESKYKPLGRRVPYPDTSGSSNQPSTPPLYDTVGASSTPYSTASRSTAFVSDSDSESGSSTADDLQDSVAYAPPAPADNTYIGADNMQPSAPYPSEPVESGYSSATGAPASAASERASEKAGEKASEKASAKTAAEPLFKIARPFVDKLTDKGAKKKQ